MQQNLKLPLYLRKQEEYERKVRAEADEKFRKYKEEQEFLRRQYDVPTNKDVVEITKESDARIQALISKKSEERKLEWKQRKSELQAKVGSAHTKIDAAAPVALNLDTYTHSRKNSITNDVLHVQSQSRRNSVVRDVALNNNASVIQAIPAQPRSRRNSLTNEASPVQPHSLRNSTVRDVPLHNGGSVIQTTLIAVSIHSPRTSITKFGELLLINHDDRRESINHTAAIKLSSKLGDTSPRTFTKMPRTFPGVPNSVDPTDAHFPDTTTEDVKLAQAPISPKKNAPNGESPRAMQFRFAKSKTNFASKSGDLQVLRTVEQSDPEAIAATKVDDYRTCRAAARGGMLGVLQWMRGQIHLEDAEICTEAARGGHFEILQWLRGVNPTYNPPCPCPAALMTHVEAFRNERGHL